MVYFIFTIFVVIKLLNMTGYEIREFIREESDGSTTHTYAMMCDEILKTHNTKGAAIVNKEQKIKDYYLYGVMVSKEVWEKKRKLS
jgi:hypothetical protein